MEATQDTLLELIGLIYDAAQDAQRWTEFLNRFAQTLNCHIAQLEIFAPKLALPASIGLAASDVRAFSSYYFRVNPWVGAVEGATPGTVALSHEIVPDAGYRASEYFNDFGKRIHQYYGLAGLIFRTSSSLCALSAVRDRIAGPCAEDDAELLRALMPHMSRAARIHAQFAGLNAEAGSLLECLDRLERGVVILNRHGRVLRVNRVAERMAVLDDGLHISESLGLRAEAPKESEVLRKLIHDAARTASGDGTSSGGTVAISRPSLRRPWIAVVSPHRVPSGEGLAAVLLIDQESNAEPSAEMVSRLFRFTAAETRLALLLAGGTRLDDAAAGLRITMNTARTHTRRMLEKTGLRRQTDLVLLLNKLPSEINPRP